jgi:hypothetical protein
VIGLICEMPAFAVTLEFRPCRVDGGAMQFHVGAPRALEELPIDREGKNIQVASTRGYTLYADLDSIDFADKGNYYRYNLYLERGSGSSGERVAFVAKGSPIGSFPPQMCNVEFILNGTIAQETISLPIFSSNQYLVTRIFAEPEDVELPGGRLLPVYLENPGGLPVRVVAVQQPDTSDLWRSAKLRQPGRPKFEVFQLGAGAKTKDRLFLEMQPGPRAIINALFWRRHKEHETVQASLICALPWENLPHQDLSVIVPVRFLPWPPLLILPVTFGALMGSIIPVLLKRREWSRWLRAFLLSWLVAIAVEIIAIVLVQYDSQFRLLGIELDPFQLLSAALIGLFMGLMGFRSVDFLKRLFT